MTPDAVARAFVDACVLDVTSLKPGNVGIHGAGHRMVAADFLRSALAAAGAITRQDATVGERILGAVRATRTAVGTNTNLGIVLLAAPLVHAALARGGGFTKRLSATLRGSTLADAGHAFEAILLAQPAGLGDAPRHDVRGPAKVTLLEAMREASSYDLVAAQYANAYADVLMTGMGAFDAARHRGATWPEAATAVFLAFLRRYPDSHVGRKLGRSQAFLLRDEAAGRLRTRTGDFLPEAPRDDLLTWDRSLKARGINPGTSADLTVATLLVALLRQASPEESFQFPIDSDHFETGGVSMAKITKMGVGESLVGDGNEVAHIDLIVGPRGSAAESAFANALVNNKDGFTSLLAVIAPNLPCKPHTVMFNKVTIKGAKQAVQMFGPAQAAVARAVQDSVADGTIPSDEANDVFVCVGVFIHWQAADDQKIYDYNYQATKEALARAVAGDPQPADVTAKRNSVKHPFSPK